MPPHRSDLYDADVADAITLAASGWLDEAADILEFGLTYAEWAPERDEALIEKYGRAYASLLEMHPELGARRRRKIHPPGQALRDP